jgi:hypothetical protein
LPFTHGQNTAGRQGISCNLPPAAAVAAATEGFAGDLQRPNGARFLNGSLSLIHAIGAPLTDTGPVGCNTDKAGWAEPIEHFNFAPWRT